MEPLRSPSRPKKGLDVSSRLVASSLHAGALTVTGPVAEKKGFSSRAAESKVDSLSHETFNASRLGNTNTLASSLGNTQNFLNSTNSSTLGKTARDLTSTTSIIGGEASLDFPTVNRPGYAQLSEAAKAFLHIGRNSERFVYDKRLLELNDSNNQASNNRVDQETFIESLNLSAEVLESLVNGSFVYLRPREGKNIYNSETCEQSDCNPHNYFTLSLSGITHYMGLKGSEFTPIAQFERERKLFNLTMSLSFFANYRMWKAFEGWRLSIVEAKQSSASEALESELFLLDAQMRRTLYELRARCASLSSISLFAIDHSRPHALDEFLEAQTERRVAVTAYLTDFSSSVRALVRSLCDQQLEAHFQSSGVVVERKMSFTERAALRKACRRLARFIRLCDFCVRDALVNLALESLRSLQQAFEGAPQALEPHSQEPEVGSVSKESSVASALGFSLGNIFLQQEEAGQASSANNVKQPLLLVSLVLEDAAAVTTQVRGRRNSLLGRRRSVDLSTSTDVSKPQKSFSATLRPVGEPPSTTNATISASSTSQQFESGINSTYKEDSSTLLAAAPPLSPVVTLAPSLNVTKTAVKGIIYDAMVVISAPPLLYTHQDLSPYVQAANVDESGTSTASTMEGDLTEMVTSMSEYKRIAGDISKGLELSFSSLDRFGRSLIPLGEALCRGELLARHLVIESMLLEAKLGLQYDSNGFLVGQGATPTAGNSVGSGSMSLAAKNSEENEFQNNALALGMGLNGSPCISAARMDAVRQLHQLLQQFMTMFHIAPPSNSQTVLSPSAVAVSSSSTSIVPLFDPLHLPKNASEFKHDISMISSFSSSIKSLAAYLTIGILRVNASDLKRRLLPLPMRLRDALLRLLPLSCSYTTRDIIAFTLAHLADVSMIAITPEQYVGRMDAVQRAGDAVQHLRSLEEGVRTLFALTAEQLPGFVPMRFPAKFKLSVDPELFNHLLQDASFNKNSDNKADGEVDELNDLSSIYPSQNSVTTTDASTLDSTELSTILSDLEQAIDRATASAEEDSRKFARLLEQSVPALKKAISTLKDQLESPIFVEHSTSPAAVLQELEALAASFETTSTRLAKTRLHQTRLGVTPVEIPIEELSDNLKVRLELWRAATEFEAQWGIWGAQSMMQVDSEAVEKALQTHFRAAVRAEQLLSVPTTSNSSSGSGIDSAVSSGGAATQLKNRLQSVRLLMPCLRDLKQSFLKPRHWQELKNLTGLSQEELESASVGVLLERRLQQHAAEIADISTRAQQEASLSELFELKISSVWSMAELQILPYKDTKDLYVLGNVEDVMSLLDESMSHLNTILGSRFAEPIRPQAEAMLARLQRVGESMDAWLLCQQQWAYLQTIFDADDIRRQLPEESLLFARVDKLWRQLMLRTLEQPLVLTAIAPGLLELLTKSNRELEVIQRRLEVYLETKRSAFPRFYFISNEELLEVLARAKDPQAVRPHLRKCFDALVDLRFTSEGGSLDLSGMVSPESEFVPFAKFVRARGNVEDWLMEVQKMMILTLSKAMRTGILAFSESDRATWVMDPVHPSQVITTVSQIMWSRMTEEALRGIVPNTSMTRTGSVNAINNNNNNSTNNNNKSMFVNSSSSNLTAATATTTLSVKDSMKVWFEQNLQQLSELTALVRGNLSALKRQTIVSLVTTDVHNRDIIEEMIHSQVDSPSSFTWQQQLRYYWNDLAHECVVQQSNASLNYGFEYEGATSRLVITPLTDKCWLTITGAFSLRLGAAPAGPAGTGKTESSKDLAKALAIQCIVFNCSDQISCSMMGRLFCGLAQTGSWTCLDEFNRIDIEVLSVVAQQVQQLRQGLLQQLDMIEFENSKIALKPHCIIITMNPGYAGRTELPDNLKVLFRPVAMMVPDYRLIAEIILFSEGFDDSKLLSTKMTKLYKLSSEQLSQQRHYDFGMRAVKSVLVMAGALKRRNINEPEDIVLIRAMRQANVPKFLAQDMPLFNAIVSDLFPGVEAGPGDTGLLQDAVEVELLQRSLDLSEEFIAKIVQLYETFSVRFGCVLVGPAMSGKSTAFEVLAAAMGTLHAQQQPSFSPVKITIVNPKAVTMGELYGEFSSLTQEWSDGVASMAIRAAVEEPAPTACWTVFDGPVDAIWIENMNTVLDDNMTLCLANGERIKLNPSMRMLFEVGDLNAASPATVSRLGVVYMPPDVLGVLPLIHSWLQTGLAPELASNEQARVLLGQLFVEAVSAVLLQFSEFVFPVQVSVAQFVNNLCQLFAALLRTAGAAEPPTSASSSSGSMEGIMVGLFGTSAPQAVNLNQSESTLIPILNGLFAFSLAWALGGPLGDGMHRVNELFHHGPLAEMSFTQHLPPGSIFDFCPLVTPTGLSWVTWASITPRFSPPPDTSFFDLVVPTAVTTKYTYLLESLYVSSRAVFFTGVTGSGKSILIRQFLSSASAPSFKRFTPADTTAINFSARTSARETQQRLESRLEKRKKAQLGAAAGRRAVIFVDDLNLPAVETYGAQPPLELLRQAMGQGGAYAQDTRQWREFVDLSYLAAAAPPGGARATTSPRLVRLFHVFCLPSPDQELLGSIFGAVSARIGTKFTQEQQQLCQALVKATTGCFLAVTKALRPTPSKSHYTFNLRDVSRVFQGLDMLSARFTSSPLALVRAWSHEACRVFCDRLSSLEDVSLVEELIWQQLQPLQLDLAQNALFGENAPILVDFLRPPDESGLGPYMEANSLQQVQQRLEQALGELPGAPRLVLFRDAVLQVCRLMRILRQNRGNCLLVGVGGSGKSSLLKVATAVAGVPLQSIELTRGYGIPEFRENLRKVILEAGAGRPVAFALSDSQIVDEALLEDISSILNTGDVPGALPNDELAKVVEETRPAAIRAGRGETRDSVLQFFFSTVMDNLHIFLLTSPVGPAFRTRCRQFPALVNCCSINWFYSWPGSALEAVAASFINADEMIVAISKDFKRSSEMPVPASKSLSEEFPFPSFDLQKVKEREESLNPGADVGLPTLLREMCVYMHESVGIASEKYYQERGRRVYTTPKSYLDLLSAYLSMLRSCSESLTRQRNTLFHGVSRLDAANVTVAELKAELLQLQPELALRDAEAAELLAVVARDSLEAQQMRSAISAEAATIQAQVEVANAVQADANAMLAESTRALNAAKEAIQSGLTPADITEAKTMRNWLPPVLRTFEAMAVLLGEPGTEQAARQLLSKSSLLSSILTYFDTEVDQRLVKKIRNYFTDAETQVSVLQRISVPMGALSSWIHAVNTVAKAELEAKPLRDRVSSINAEVSAASEKLHTKQTMLAEVLAKVEALEKQAAEVSAQKKQLEAESQLTKERLERANQLTSGLADEGVRWRQSVTSMDEQIRLLVGDVMLAVGTVSYLGPFEGSYREMLLVRWRQALLMLGIPFSTNYSLTATLGSPVQLREWQMVGLPSDSVSVDNALIAFHSKRWPLLVDPQEQGKRWLKGYLSNSSTSSSMSSNTTNPSRYSASSTSSRLLVTRLNDPKLLQLLEAAIPQGTPVLVEDVLETIDSALEPLLQRQFVQKGFRQLLRLGDKDVEYNPEFRLFFTSKMSNPHYLPELFIKVNVVNFTVTLSGLEEQVLAEIVRTERPDVEEKRATLVLSMARDKRQLRDLEDKTLRLLSEAKTSLVDDKELVDALSNSRLVSVNVESRLKESQATELDIEAMRNEYRPLAVRAALLFFTISDLAKIDPMYQFSLTYFVELFVRFIRAAPVEQNKQATLSKTELQQRLRILKSFTTIQVFRNVSRGLFEKDKLLFAFLLAVSVGKDNGSISQLQLDLLLRGAGTLIHPRADACPLPQLPPSSWNLVFALEQLPVFAGLSDSILKHSIPQSSAPGEAASVDGLTWNAVLDNDLPEVCALPEGLKSRLSAFDRLLLARTLTPQRVFAAAANYVRECLGQEYVNPTVSSLNETLNEAHSGLPVVFMLSSGADPTQQLLTLAKQRDFLHRLSIVSLGQGQGARARRVIELAIEQGDWVLLQNCHLGKSWMNELEQIVLQLSASSSSSSTGGMAPLVLGKVLNPQFRLFLTTMPAPYFPPSILQASLKLTNEPPKGLRANVLRSLSQLETLVGPVDELGGPEEFSDGMPKAPVWRKLLFSLVLFHGVVQERRRFGPLGFNTRYEFNDSDLETSALVLRRLLAEEPEIKWAALKFTFGVINYGGRVTDALDQLCLNAVLAAFISPNCLIENHPYSSSPFYVVPPLNAPISKPPITTDEGSGDEHETKDVEQDRGATIQFLYDFVQKTYPQEDDTAVFGLHSNANISSQRADSDALLNSVLSLQGRSTSSSTNANSATNSDSAIEIALQRVAAALPTPLDLHAAGPTTFVYNEAGLLDALGTFLQQEIERMGILLQTISSSISDIQLALRGELLLSAELDAVVTSLLDNRVPKLWADVAYPSLKPLGSWLTDLGARAAALDDWLRRGPPNSFWLPGMFFPQGFLTAVLQKHARKYSQAVDQLTFTFRLLDAYTPQDLTTTVSDGVVIHGLFIEGATWSSELNSLQDPLPGEMFAKMPCIHLVPSLVDKVISTSEGEAASLTYSAPLYKTSLRSGTLSTTGMSTNFIISVTVPTNVNPNVWTLRGTALLSQLPD